ncbi:MAG: histidine kinase, partial [Pseudomonadota bacterium]|nr:histidine kinase [Pseudomonadota bacterium]
WIAYLTADRERTEVRRAAATTVVQVAEQVTAELLKELEVAEALAGSLFLDRPDLPAFYEQAQRLTAARPLWETVSLAAPDRSQVLNILQPLGEPGSAIPDEGSFERVLQEKRAVIGGIGPVGRISGKRLVPIRVPVVRGGELRYILTVGLIPSGISTILRKAGPPEHWTGAIVDAQGNIVARTAAESTEIGRPANQAVRDAIARASEGFYVGRSLEDVEVETIFQTLPRPSGWSVHFGIPADSLNRPVLQSLYALLVGGAASLALGGGLALLVTRDVAQRRREEAARAALELSLSEDRGAVAVEAAELGTWRFDSDREEFAGSERTRILLNLPPGPAGRSFVAWSLAQFLTALHASDRERAREAIRRCLSKDEPIDIEVRSLRQDGSVRWVRMNGRCPQSEPRLRTIHGVVADIEPRKQAEAEHQALLRLLAEAQESEQRRIARELHDQVGQTVTGLSLGLKGLERAIKSGTRGERLEEQLHHLRHLANEIGRDIHRAASDLRPVAIDDLGLHKALAAYLEEWRKLTGIATDIQVLGQVRRLPLATEAAVYRVAQEALTNVAKHTSATSVSIVMEFREQELRVVIEDNGAGIDPARINVVEGTQAGRDRRAHLGILGMHERLALLEGSLTIEASPGSGTTLFVQVPIPRLGAHP